MSLNPYLVVAVITIGIITGVNSINSSGTSIIRPIWIVAAFIFIGLSLCGMFLIIEEAHKRDEQEKARLEMLKKLEEEAAANGVKDEYYVIVQFVEDDEELAYKCDLPNVYKGDIVRVMINGKEKSAKVARLVKGYKPYVASQVLRLASKEERMLWSKNE